MSSLQFVIYCLATWRLSYLLVNEDGPYNMLGRIRENLESYTTVLTCVWCSSIWIGMLAALATFHTNDIPILLIIPLTLAYSSVAIFITEILEGNDEE